MLRDEFIESDEWQAITTYLHEVHVETVARLRGAANFETTRYLVGMLDSIESFIDLPNKLFADGSPKPETKHPDGTVDLPHHPNPTRSPF